MIINPYEPPTKTIASGSASNRQTLVHAFLFGPCLALVVGAVHGCFVYVTSRLGETSAIIPERFLYFVVFLMFFNMAFGIFLGVFNAIVIKGFAKRIPWFLYFGSVLIVAILTFGTTAYRELSLSPSEPDLIESWMLPMGCVYLAAGVLTIIVARSTT